MRIIILKLHIQVEISKLFSLSLSLPSLKLSFRWIFNPAVLTKCYSENTQIITDSQPTTSNPVDSSLFLVDDLVQVCSDFKRVKIYQLIK